MASLIEGRPLTAEPWLSPGSQPHISGIIRRWRLFRGQLPGGDLG